MKYGYEGVEKKELIQKYEICDHKIVITFLDGSFCEVPFTEENETRLLEQMTAQAEQRSLSSALSAAKEERKWTFRWVVLQTILTVTNILGAFTTEEESKQKIIALLGAGAALATIMNIYRWKKKSNEIEELEKYDLYLWQIREKLESMTDQNLLSIITEQGAPLNINTLDQFSLKDMKKISDLVARIETYASYFESSDSTGPNAKTYVKKEDEKYNG